MSKTRPSTTINDVTKKIQSLRTQYGQEQSKIDKSKTQEPSGLEYVPTIWWFSELGFIKDFMKKRTDGILPTIKKDKKTEPDFDDTQEFIITDFEIEEESEPQTKKFKKLTSPILKQNNSRIVDSEYEASITEEDSHTQTIEYTLVNDNELTESTSNQQQSSHILDISTIPQINIEKNRSKRNKGLGKFVSSSMTGIIDDSLFFRTQKEVLNIIFEAQMKQIEINNKIGGK